MNKTYLLLLCAVLFLLVAVIYFNLRHGHSEAERAEITPTQEDVIREALKDPQADPDSDGLKNWEEDLYGSSKRNSDSDGDGIPDGVEVSQGTDPTLYGAISFTGETELVQEDVHAEEFTAIAPDIDYNNLQKIFSGDARALAEYAGIGTTTAAGSASDLTPEQQQIKDELNQLATILQNSLVTTEQDIQILEGYLSGINNNSLAIDRLVNATLQASQRLQLQKVNIAHPMVSTQWGAFANIYTQQHDALSSLRSLRTTDASLRSGQWQKYSAAINQWVSTVVSVHDFVLDNDISFSSSEPGFFFMFNLGI